MIRLHLTHNAGYAWQRLPWKDHTLHYKGNRWEIGAALEALTGSGPPDRGRLAARLAELPWHFAVVLQGPDTFFAAVDRLRTHPLFYGGGETLRLTDNPYTPGLGLDLAPDAALPRAEFELAGYVTGRDTLTSSLHSLQAGEALWAEESGGRTAYHTGWYRAPIHNPAMADSRDEAAIPALMAVCDDIFAELCAGARDRQIVLPLSSGVDSRFIAAMLKRHGHQNVVTYTYGKPGNWEMEVSRQTAARLGYPWHFVPYSRPLWRQWYASPDMAAYQPFASRHVATPHVQDWPAVQQLTRQGLVDESAIFAPGHTCVLISNRLERAILGAPTPSRLDALAASLFSHHYILQRTGRVTDNPAPLVARLRALLPDDAAPDPHRLLNAYFHFESSERHGKMLINSVRVYEFWGHQWALPLWDGRLVDFWASTPFEGRFGKRLFREFLYKTNLYDLFPRPAPPGFYARTRQAVKNNPLTYPPLKRLKCMEERLLGYFHHFLDWYGIVSYPEYVYHMGRCGNVYSLLSRLYLKSLIAAGGILDAGPAPSALPDATE